VRRDELANGKPAEEEVVFGGGGLIQSELCTRKEAEHVIES